MDVAINSIECAIVALELWIHSNMYYTKFIFIMWDNKAADNLIEAKKIKYKC